MISVNFGTTKTFCAAEIRLQKILISIISRSAGWVCVCVTERCVYKYKSRLVVFCLFFYQGIYLVLIELPGINCFQRLGRLLYCFNKSYCVFNSQNSIIVNNKVLIYLSIIIL